MSEEREGCPPGCVRCVEIGRIVNVKDSRQVEGMSVGPRQAPSPLCKVLDHVVLVGVGIILGMTVMFLIL